MDETWKQQVTALVVAGSVDEAERRIQQAAPGWSSGYPDHEALAALYEEIADALPAGQRESAHRLYEKSLECWWQFASGATSGGEGMALMLNVERVKKKLAGGPSREPDAVVAALPAGAEELLEKSVPELESELRRLGANCRLPPSAIRGLFESYALQCRLMDDASRERQQRTFLINAIVAYGKPELRSQAGEEWPLEALIEVALEMPMKIGDPDEPQRREILDSLLREFDAFDPEDRDFYRRQALAGFIKANSADPRVLDTDILRA